jgi:RND superfamily putative drug exporter
MRAAYDRDLTVILPVAGALILVVLALLLRSLVAPWYLMAAVMATFGASLGVGVLLIQTLAGESGMSFILPIMLYVFVIAIGTDYNILMVARLREEAHNGVPPREAVALAVEHAGPAVAGAAVILAGTFGTLTISGVGLLVQLGLTVAIGVLLAAVMALLLVPGLTALVGRAAWWPGRAGRSRPAGRRDHQGIAAVRRFIVRKERRRR